MYELNLPALDETPGHAHDLIRDWAESAHPGLGELAGQVTVELVSHALHYTPQWEVIRVQADITESGVRISASDPGQPQHSAAGRDFGQISKLAHRWGASSSPESHCAWAEVRART